MRHSIKLAFPIVRNCCYMGVPMPKSISRLFCFDFDNTIVDGHFHNALYDMGVASGKASPEQIALLLNKHSIFNEELLLKTFRTILNNGHHLAITTWSEYPEVIAPTLQKLGLTEAEIAQIHIEAGIPASLELRKSTHIAKAKQHFGVNDNQHVFLIDDDEDNILQARKEGQTGFHAASPKTNTDYLQNILNVIEKPAPRRSVRIASLNTIEGQRLFEVRNNLQAQGKRRTGKRKDEEKPLTRFLAKNPQATPVAEAAQLKQSTPESESETKTENAPASSANNIYLLAAHQQIHLMHMKKLWAAIFLCLSIAAMLWFTAVSTLLIIVASSFTFSAVLIIGEMQVDRMQQAAKERTKDKANWTKNNQAAFELGCNSAKAWMPYLKSYVHPKGYTSAYELGLNETGFLQKGLALESAESTPKPK